MTLRFVVRQEVVSTETDKMGGGLRARWLNEPWTAEPAAARAWTRGVESALDEMPGGPDAFVVLPVVGAAGRQDAAARAVGYARWLVPLAEYAARRGVRLLQTTGGPFVTAKHLWHLYEAVSHLAFGLAVDARDRTLDPPAVLIPTLGSRIALLFPPADPPAARPWLTKLRGIGSAAWVVCASAEERAKLEGPTTPAATKQPS